MIAAEGSLPGARLVVTGGCGFLGSHLVRRLLDEGAGEVVVVDSLRSGHAEAVTSLGPRARLVRQQLGVDGPHALAPTMAGAAGLFHFAAEKYHSTGTTLDVLRTNVAGTCALFEAARAAGVPRIVFASSVYAYGRRAGPPMREDEGPQPRTAYGLSKLLGERLLAHLAAEGVAGVALRYFFVYGPRQHTGAGYRSVIVRNYERLLRGEAPTVYGDGRQALDYVYVDDAVEAAVRAFAAGRPGAVYNVGSGAATAIDDLVDRMMRAAGRHGRKEYLPPDETAGTTRVADVSRIAGELDWRARIGLDEGLARTWQWMKGVAAA
jgi:UDP-glucose 4-epimerase